MTTANLSPIRLLVLDVDGVLTDGAITYTSDGQEIKSFHSQDGFGIRLAQQAGLQFGVLTGRVSEMVAQRVKELHIAYYEAGHFHKRAALQKIIKTAGLEPEQVLYMGDEILDLVCKPEVGVFAAPANAVARVQAEADWVTHAAGGQAAVREMIDAVLQAQGVLASTEDYFIQAEADLSGDAA